MKEVKKEADTQSLNDTVTDVSSSCSSMAGEVNKASCCASSKASDNACCSNADSLSHEQEKLPAHAHFHMHPDGRKHFQFHEHDDEHDHAHEHDHDHEHEHEHEHNHDHESVEKPTGTVHFRYPDTAFFIREMDCSIEEKEIRGLMQKIDGVQEIDFQIGIQIGRAQV